MRQVLQRVSEARVRVGEKVVGEIGRGLLVLVGIEAGDGEEQVDAAARTLSGLRVFEDDAGRMNLDLRAVDGAFLLVSQFTLAGDPLAKGRRPSFDGAAPPAEAEALFGCLVERLRELGHRVETGEFGAHMAVELVNDGPVTFVWENSP